MADRLSNKHKANPRRIRRRLEKFLTGEPSPRFMLRVRRVLVIMWLLILLLYVPKFIAQYYDIQAVLVTGTGRDVAMWELLKEAATVLVVGPLFLFAILGYGIRVRYLSVITGGPWFDTWWHPSRKQKSKRSAGKE